MRNSPVMTGNMQNLSVMTASMQNSQVIKDDRYMSHIGHRNIGYHITSLINNKVSQPFEFLSTL